MASTVQQNVARCLVKDPRDRLRDIGEARLALGNAPDVSGTVQTGPTPVVWRLVPWLVTTVVVVVAGWALWSRTPSRKQEETELEAQLKTKT